jgi:hypothetical protein
MQAYSSTLLQSIFKFQLVYFPYFYDDKVQKNAPIWCIVATKWCIVISQDILEIEKYQPKTRDICRFQALFAFICPNLIIGVVEAASSSLVTQTKNEQSSDCRFSFVYKGFLAFLMLIQERSFLCLATQVLGV